MSSNLSKDKMRKRNEYNVKQHVTLRNLFNNESVSGDIVNEADIEGKPFWVIMQPNRPSRIRLAKDAWALSKGK